MASDSKGLRILVADDTEIARELVVRILEKQGHDVTAVADGLRAVEAYRNAPAPFDLVLMDVEMPVLDGPAATAAIAMPPKKCKACFFIFSSPPHWTW